MWNLPILNILDIEIVCNRGVYINYTHSRFPNITQTIQSRGLSLFYGYVHKGVQLYCSKFCTVYTSRICMYLSFLYLCRFTPAILTSPFSLLTLFLSLPHSSSLTLTFSLSLSFSLPLTFSSSLFSPLPSLHARG